MKDNLVRLLKTTPDRFVSKGTTQRSACLRFCLCLPSAHHKTQPSWSYKPQTLNASGRELLELRTTGLTSRPGRTRRWIASERAVRCRATLCCSCQGRLSNKTRHAPTRACMLHSSILAARSNKKCLIAEHRFRCMFQKCCTQSHPAPANSHPNGCSSWHR